ncbi:DUF2771 domain-containing protein [Nocardia sp. NPDC057440]|uniref:DUF2771 domain-containing protein n=1 Tax=Nocardia sp. NPDC057440 TaxID=3346134 RepID=UPI00366A8282
MSKPGTRTLIALGTAAALVFVVAFVGVLAVLIRNAPESEPEITAYAHGTAITVRPYGYCTPLMQDCRILPERGGNADVGSIFSRLPCGESTPDCQTGKTFHLEVPAGYPLQMSLPTKIADAPWIARLVYALPNGDTVDRIVSRNDYPKGALNLTIDSKPEPDLRLIGVEMQLPILAKDETGQEFYLPHAAWSISTA